MYPFDATGRRGGKGVKSSPKVRSSNFPYDNARPALGGIHRGITPKRTDHSTWDDIGEAIGIPFNVKMADKPQGATGVPGVHGGWSGMPSLPWDDESKFDEESLYVDRQASSTDDYTQMAAHPAVEVKPVDLTMTIMTVARDLLSPGTVWSELITRLEGLNISSRK